MERRTNKQVYLLLINDLTKASTILCLERREASKAFRELSRLMMKMQDWQVTVRIGIFTSQRMACSWRADQHGCSTYHHLADGLHDVVHLGARDEAIVVNVIEPERPCRMRQWYQQLDITDRQTPRAGAHRVTWENIARYPLFCGGQLHT